MHHEASRLVDDHQLVVFVNHIEGNVLRFDATVKFRAIEHQSHHVIRLNAVVALHGTPIDMDATSFGSRLDAIARGVVHEIDEKLIYTQELLSFVGNYSIVFIELTLSRSGSDFHLFVGRS